ncbi:Flavonol 3-O-glucosyltransferase [Euphorbia peplus]|nr:Flavonol 3-O-glucosyltransferase [Euphorbia peplus]
MSIKIIQKHVAVLVFPSSSHPQTLMTLSLKLANSAPDILFSFFSTEKANQSLLSSSPDLHLPSNIKIYDVEDGVPMAYRFTGKPHEHVNLFLSAAQEILTRRIKTVVEETGIKITCILSDAFLTFSGEIADKFGVSWIAFWTAMPISLSAHLYTQIIRKKYATQEIDQELDFIPGLSLLRVKDLPAEVLAVGDKESVFSKELSLTGETLPKATAVIISCFEELVPEVINNDLKSKFNNYLNLGILSMSQQPESESDTTGCLSWLDRQSSKSVAYIAFGNKAALPEKELKALAEALEFSKIPFLWSLKDSLKEKLPNGFVERTSKQVYGDQMTMARMVQVGWEIGVTVDDGVITKNGLLKNLEMFFPSDDEQGKQMRENVEQLKKVVLNAALPGAAAARDFSKLIDIISMV